MADEVSSLDENVVHPPALVIHGDANTRVPKNVREPRAGELAALVGVEDPRQPVARQGLLQGFDAEVGVQGVRHPPGQDLPRRPVHDRDR